MTNEAVNSIKNGLETMLDDMEQTRSIGESAVAQEVEVALVTHLGGDNAGSLGPVGKEEIALSEKLLEDFGKEEYSKPASNCWICIDGRLSHAEKTAAEAGKAANANPQIAGSYPLSQTAASYMGDPTTHQPLSVVIPAKTEAAIADGLRIMVHGANNNTAGCAANAAMREALGYMVANADIIIPTAWELIKVAQLDDVIAQDDLAESAVSANNAVENEMLWDATPEKVIELAIEAGAEYMDLVGEHKEKVTRVDMSKGAFAKARFVLDHKVGDEEVQAFSASFGAYVEVTLRRAEKHGISRRDAGLEIAHVFMYNIALTKMLKNDAMPVGVVAEVN